MVDIYAIILGKNNIIDIVYYNNLRLLNFHFYRLLPCLELLYITIYINIIVKSLVFRKIKYDICYINLNKHKMTLIEIKNNIEDLSNGYQLHKSTDIIWSDIMQLADEKKHFASEIVERATMDHKRISEKQAWVVAYFAKNNGLIN